MVEGGKIDWACHANDAMATIGDMLDFDDAVGVALEFLQKHPRNLVIVTGDHETGGMTVGHATTAYTAYYDRLIPEKQLSVLRRQPVGRRTRPPIAPVTTGPRSKPGKQYRFCHDL